MSRTCPECGAGFASADARKIYCTKRCKNRQKGREWRRRNPYVRTTGQARECAYCMAPFVAMRKDKRYCSDMCCSTAAAIRSAKRNPERVRVHKRRWAASNAETVRVKRAKWRAANKETLRAKARDYYMKNRETIAAKQAAALAANPERFHDARRRWERANPDALRAKKLRRRGNGAVGSAELSALRGILGDTCLRCGDGPTTWDHVIPVARGGTNAPANLQPLCRSCNSKKGHRSQDDYRTVEQIRAVAERFGGRGAYQVAGLG